MKKFNPEIELQKKKRKYTKKHLVFSLLGLIALTVLGISFAYYEVNDNSVIIDSNTKAPINITIMQGEEEVNTVPGADTEYVYDKTVCENNSTATWDEDTRQIKIDFKDNDDCVVHFIIPPPFYLCLKDYENQGVTPTADNYFTITETTDAVVITGYSNEGPKDVVIPCEINDKAVTTIANDAFNEKELTSVVLPNLVTEIKYRAFNQNKLTEIVIPDSVTYLSGFDQNQLTNITIPNSVTTIGGGAFNGNQLTELTIPNSVTTIEVGAFSGGNKITNINFGSSLETIGDQAFAYNLFNDLTIPSSVQNIGKGAFENAIKGHITIEEGTTNVDDFAFTMSGATGLTLPSTLKTIGEYAFGAPEVFGMNLHSNLGNVVIPDNVTSIGVSAFNGAGITNLTIGTGISLIDDYTFMSNSFEGNIIIPDNVTSIGIQAFSYNFDMNGANTVFIPNSVRNIDREAFMRHNINTFTIEDSDSPSNYGTLSINNAIFDSSRISTLNLGTSLGSLSETFSMSTAPEEITLPESLKHIGNYTFDSWTTKTINIKGKTSEADFTTLGPNWNFHNNSELIINYLG